MKLLRACAAALISLAVVFIQTAGAAPFAETVEFTQPNGETIQLWGQGDDFQAVFETLDGYTVVFEIADKAYYYAELNADGSALLSTGVLVGENRPAGLQPHLRINQQVAAQQARARQQLWEQQTGIRERWNALKRERRTYESALSEGPVLMAPPATVGQITGIVLLIDFDDAPQTVARSEITKYCNMIGYNGYGNNGSVRDYFMDVSNGMLEYTNVVTAYVRIPNSLHNKDYYLNPARGAGESANELIKDALTILKAQPDFATVTAPLIDYCTVNNAGRALALNVFYAGGNGGVWAQGLWPHMWGLYQVGAIQLTQRTAVFTYQITNIGSELTIGTFCHENGHMICGYPDIYDYDYDSVGGAGMFCIMNSGGHGKNPVQPCAYLKQASGWTTTVEVEPYTYVAATVASRMSHPDFNKIYRARKPGVNTEYYLFEARSSVDRDAAIPAQGLFIWHIDELGDRDNQSYEYNAQHLNYECALVQADGLNHFERNINSGDANDSWYAGNSAAGYSNRFKDTTIPSSKWWDGSDSRISIGSISPQGEVMTFDFIPPTPLMLSAPGALPYGREWDPYLYSIGLTGSSGPVIWSVVSGALPEGLNLGSADGIIAGTPTQATNAFFDVEVMTSYDVAVTNSFSLLILPVHTTPYEENFDLDNGAIPDSWKQSYLTNALDWRVVQSRNTVHPPSAHTPVNMISLYSYSYADSVTKLITPRIDFGESGRAGRLSFRHFMQNWVTSQDELRVFYKTEMEGEWTLLATYVNDVTAWTERVIDLPAISRSVYIAFQGTARYGHGVCVDTLKVWDPTPPYDFVTPSPLPNAIIGEYYELLLQAEGGYEPYTFSVVSNSLPAGLFLSPTGMIYGIAGSVQRTQIGIQVLDDQGQILVRSYALAVTEPIVDLFAEDFEHGGSLPYGWTQSFINHETPWVINDGGYNDHPPTAQQGAFNAMFFAADRDPDTGIYRTHRTRLITPQINLGQAPENITLYFWHCMESYDGDLDDLKIYYKSTIDGEWNQLASFNQSTPQWTERAVPLPNPSSTYYIAFEGSARFGYGVCIDNIRITDESSSPIITTDRDLPDGLIGVAYARQMAATGGVPPYSWDMAGGSLPAGLTLSADGLLSGTPESVYIGDFFVKVTDFEGFASTNRFNLRIKAVRGLPYFENFENGGVIPDGWSQERISGSVDWASAAGTTCPDSTRRPVKAYSGLWNLALYSNSGAQSPAISRLISPMINMGGGVTNATLTFRHYMEEWGGDQDELRVFYRTSSTAAWVMLELYRSNTASWSERTVALPNPSGTYFVAFEGRAQYGYGICIDDVSFSGYVPSPYNDWLGLHFTQQEIDDGLITGYYDDADDDSYLNIWEYAFDLDPRIPDVTGNPTGGVFNHYLQLSYRQNMLAKDLDFIVEACTDLKVGDWSTNNISEITRDEMGSYWSVTRQHDVPVTNAPARFMRLKLMIN